MFEDEIPHQREPYKHSNHGITDGPQYYNNLKLQLYEKQLLNAWPTQWFDSPLPGKNRDRKLIQDRTECGHYF